MKKTILVIIITIFGYGGFACPACEEQQSGFFRGITHGSGPDSRWDYLIVAAMATIVAATLYFSVKWLIRPGENSRQHIKRFILNEE